MSTNSDQKSSSLPLTERDRTILSLSDDQYHPLSWEELKQIIAEHDLGKLTRWPSDLKRYIKWSSETKAKYGRVSNYIMEVRLKWQPIPNSTSDTGPQFAVQNPIPFQDPQDYKIMPNDWPYGFAPEIRHVVVWLKNRLDSEPTKGDLTPHSRKQVEDFVQTMFIDRVKDLPGPSEKVMWFKNWKELQSVPGMEHVHVLLRDVPEEMINEWTGGVQIKQDTES